MPVHAHPMVNKSDVASLNARYAPWRIAKSHVRSVSGRGHFVTVAWNTETCEEIYRGEGWTKASRGQALNAILERRNREER